MKGCRFGVKWIGGYGSFWRTWTFWGLGSYSDLALINGCLRTSFFCRRSIGRRSGTGRESKLDCESCRADCLD